MPERRLLTVAEAAARVGVDPKTLRRWEQLGKIPRVVRTIGGHRRYPEDVVAAIVDARSARWAVYSVAARAWLAPSGVLHVQLEDDAYWDGHDAARDRVTDCPMTADGRPSLLAVGVPLSVRELPEPARLRELARIVGNEGAYQARARGKRR